MRQYQIRKLNFRYKLCQELIKLRCFSNTTIDDMAEILELDRHNVLFIEECKAIITYDICKKYCEVAGVDIKKHFLFKKLKGSFVI